MSACKYTERISATECIGDSLSKINQNFLNLDYGLCEKTNPAPGHATTVSSQTTELGDSVYKINAKNSFSYNTRFDSAQIATYGTKLLPDGTSLGVTTFPYVAVATSPKPQVTFTSVALTDTPPTVSLYWLASGDGLTLNTFPLNSATPTDKGITWFNGTVTSLLSSDSNNLYVGGTFTTVGSALAEKLVRINVSSPVGYVDSTNPITNLGTVGEVKQIIEQTLTISGLPRKFIIVGGSFENIGIRGRGLLIYNATDNIFYHFYVNGEVNAIKTRDNILWVGGNFNYVNTGTSAASTFSGRRVETNGLFTVNLNGLWAGLTTAAIQDRSSVFEERAIINSIELYKDESLFYVGGQFLIKETPERIKCSNVCCLKTDGTLYESWRPIVDGVVYKIILDDVRAAGDSVYLYIAGEFSAVYSQTEFYLTPRIKDENKTKYYNAFSVKLTDLGSLRVTPERIHSWKPKFNGPVTAMLSHDSDPTTHIYCYGKYTTVNDSDTNYLAAIKKASSFERGQLVSDWVPSIQNSPSLINNALARGNNGLLVGGNFTQVNNFYRYNLAEIGDTSWSAPALSGFMWDFASQSLTTGMKISFDAGSTYSKRISALPVSYDSINVSTFTVPSDAFNGLHAGQLLRFAIKRPGNSLASGSLSATDDTFKQDVYVVGYKLDFN